MFIFFSETSPRRSGRPVGITGDLDRSRTISGAGSVARK